MILFWHKLKEGERSRALLDRALLAYCDAIGKRRPRKKNRSVAETEHGKPYYPALPSVFCSVSHSRGWWVCLFDKHPCGVDVEETGRSRANDAVIRRKFTPEEQALFGEQTGCADPGSAGEATFLRVWTRKEAYLKYTGEGLTRDTLSFSVAGTDAAGRPCFLGDAEPFYGEPRIVLEEIDFSAVTDPDGQSLPLIGAVCGTWSELSVLPLPEPAAEESLEAAKEIALDLVEARPRTEKEVREKLRAKDVLPEDADRAVAFLKEYGFLNDRLFAEQYAEDAVRKGRGPLRIERDLVRQGIARETARAALGPYRGAAADPDAVPDDPDTPTFRETADALARKVWEAAGSPPELDEKLSAKILRRLASRGFTAADSYAALADLRGHLRTER